MGTVSNFPLYDFLDQGTAACGLVDVSKLCAEITAIRVRCDEQTSIYHQCVIILIIETYNRRNYPSNLEFPPFGGIETENSSSFDTRRMPTKLLRMIEKYISLIQNKEEMRI